jgi:transcriptional regulator with XRE-family HTH domain
VDNYFSKNLKFLRESRKLSLQAFSDEIGLSKSVLNQYELGNTEPTLGPLIKIIRYFGCNLSEMTDIDLEVTPTSKAEEPKTAYGFDQIKKLEIENNTLREALREIGKGIKN